MKRKRETANRPTPGETDAWMMLGYLRAAIETDGHITVADWNRAIECGDDGARRIAVQADGSAT